MSEPLAYRLAGSAMFLHQRWPEADALLREGLALYPDFTDLVFLRGLVAQKQGAHARAVGLFRRALAMGSAPQEGAHADCAGAQAHEALAWSYAALGQTEEAAAQFAAAWAAEPGRTSVLAGLAALLSPSHSEEALLERLRSQLGPERSVLLPEVLLVAGRPDLALTLAADPVLSGRALLELGRYSEAADALAQADHAGGALLAAFACDGGPTSLARHRRFQAPDYRAAAAWCLEQERFWLRAAARPHDCPPWAKEV